MNIVVAGTGFSSILCINHLVELGLKPTVIDIGNEISEVEKIALKRKTLIHQKNPDNFNCIGGLSGVWSGVIEKYLSSDFIDWPISKDEFNNFYNEVFEILNMSKKYTFQSNSKNDLLDYHLKLQSGSFQYQIYNNDKISVKHTSVLLNKSDEANNADSNYKIHEPFNLKHIIKDHIKKRKIDYRKEKILKLSETNNQVIIETLNNNQKKRIICDYLFLGCGTVSTYLIMKNSIANFDNNLKIKSTKQFVLPVRFNNLKNFENRFYNNFPIFQINLKNLDNYSIYSQVYNLNPNIINYFFPKIKNFKRYYSLIKLFKNFGFSYFVLGSDLVDQFIVDHKNNHEVYETKYKISDILLNCKHLFDRNLFDGQFFHYKMPIKMKILSGNYYGSVFPMNEVKKNFYSSDIFGRIGNFKKISITDTSIFPKLSARPPTLTILANSLRIAKKVSENNFFS